MQTDQIYEKMVARLQDQQVYFILHEHAPSSTFADAANYLSFPLERLVKTIAFQQRSGGWILAALRGQDRVDYRKLASAIGGKRDDISSLSPQEVLEIFGVEAGSVGPLLKSSDTQVLCDKRIPTEQTIFCGIGRADRTLEITFSDLLPLVDGKVVDLVKEN